MLTDPLSRLPSFQVAVTDDGGVHLAISGELDVTTLATLADQVSRLAEIRPVRLIVDMSEVEFLDWASARLLASTAAILPPGRRPVLTSAQAAVRRLLQLTGLAAYFELAD